MRQSLPAFPLLLIAAVLVLLMAVTAGWILEPAPGGGHHAIPPTASADLKRYASGADLAQSFTDAQGPMRTTNSWGSVDGTIASVSGIVSGSTMPVPMPVPTVAADSTASYSTTNVQVAGVDEGDTVKTDGTYIYLISGDSLIIARAYPASDAAIVSRTSFTDLTPGSLFVDGDRLLLIGTSGTGIRPLPASGGGEANAGTSLYWYAPSTTVVKLYDISDRSSPRELKSFQIEGSYLTSRLIGDYAYFVVNSYPAVYNYVSDVNSSDIVPLCQEADGAVEPVAAPTDIGYVPGIATTSFITVASVSMTDASRNITTQTIAGSGQSVYASEDSLYVAESCYSDEQGGIFSYYRDENTTVLKFDLDDGNIDSAGAGIVPGAILNQYSMDEYDGYFRIATTVGSVTDTVHPAENNIYVLDGDMHTVGSLEDLAPGEEIYSSLFTGDRCYLVTFKKVDPLFVVDLSNPESPTLLGKLSIPGFSDYLYPLDDTHLIGIGKDAVDAEPSEVASRGLDFAWYQGLKIALFDVSDVSHPVELSHVLIGDRGTDSPALTDPHAFLFDRSRDLLILPVTLAQVQGAKTSDDEYGQYVYQGDYVYNVSLQDGFTLRGRVTQYDDSDPFAKSGYYFYGDRSITRSLYIGNVLYTVSSTLLQMNDIDTLDEITALDLGTPLQPPVCIE